MATSTWPHSIREIFPGKNKNKKKKNVTALDTNEKKENGLFSVQAGRLLSFILEVAPVDNGR